MIAVCQHHQPRRSIFVHTVNDVTRDLSVHRAFKTPAAAVVFSHRNLSCRDATASADTASSNHEADQHAIQPYHRDRKPPRKASNVPTVLVQSGEAAAAGPLPDVLAATFPDSYPTLSAARRAIRKDLILVDGTVGTCKTEVQLGQPLQQLEPVAKHKAPRTVSLEVAFEDDVLAVVHKPWGVKMYGGDARRTITGALRAGALNPSIHPDALPEPKPVHRLDAAVGGLLVVAKTAAAVADLSAQFQGRRVHKVYHALLSGRLDPNAAVAQPERLQQHQQQKQTSSESSRDDVGSEPATGEDDAAVDLEDQQQQQEEADSELLLPELLQLQLQGEPAFTTTAADLDDPHMTPYTTPPLAEGPSNSSSSSNLGLDPGVNVIDLPLEGKRCYTLYQVLGYSRCPRFGGWMTTVALSPVTGRKHQLRQHMAAIGHPIVGDGKYAINKEEHISNQGIYLESLEVLFTHPDTSQLMHVEISEPQRFKTLRGQQHKRWNKLAAAAAAAEEA